MEFLENNKFNVINLQYIEHKIISFKYKISYE
jgi:hypothetical protein